MYYEYASRKADVLEHLQILLMAQGMGESEAQDIILDSGRNWLNQISIGINN